MSDADLRTRIKEMMVKNLMLQITADQIADDSPLFGPNGIGLDSIDALEIGIALRKRYAITIETATDEVKSYFRDIRSLAKFVRMKRG